MCIVVNKQTSKQTHKYRYSSWNFVAIACVQADIIRFWSFGYHLSFIISGFFQFATILIGLLDQNNICVAIGIPLLSCSLQKLRYQLLFIHFRFMAAILNFLATWTCVTKYYWQRPRVYPTKIMTYNNSFIHPYHVYQGCLLLAIAYSLF